MFFIRLPRS